MKRWLRPLLCVLGVGLLALAMLSCRSTKSYRAERFDVDISIQEGNNALITETVVFDFRGGPFTYAFREIPTDKTDGIEIVSVSGDGEVFVPGNGPGQYSLRRKASDLRLTWFFPPTSNGVRTLAVTYRVRGLVRQEGQQDALRWGAIPPEHDYGITESQVVVRLPDSVGTINGAVVLGGRAQVGVLGQQASFLAKQIERDEELTIAVTFPHGQLGGVPPAWQRTAQAQDARAPLWIALASLILLAGLGSAIWLWRRYGREHVPEPAGPQLAPPGDLPPGLAGTLVHNRATLADAMATLFDLANRGVLCIEELAQGKVGRAEHYGLRLAALPPDLQPFEVAILTAAFLSPPSHRRAPAPDAAGLAALVGGEPVSLARVLAGLNRNWRTVGKALEGTLYERGLLAKPRDAIRRNLALAGGAAMLLALASIAVPLVWGALFGAWPALLSTALFILGIVYWILCGTTARRSVAGEEMAGYWRSFRRHLQQLARARPTADQVPELQRYLPFALAFDLGQRWSVQLGVAGAPVPPWFHALSQEAAAADASYIAVIVAASAAGASGAAGASAAGGAAGGGASGAG